MLGNGRPGYWNSGGVMGQMPLQGALAYTPQGHGVTGFDSQGLGMGSGSVAKKAAGFDGMFGNGMQRGGRIGFQDGGLAGLGIDPNTQYMLQNQLAALEKQPDASTQIATNISSTPQHRGSGAPSAPKAGAAPQTPVQAAGAGLASGLSKNVSQSSSQGSIDDLTSSDFADISSGGPDMSSLADNAFDYGLGGVVRSRRGFQDGGDASGGAAAAAAAAAAASGATATSPGGVGIGNPGGAPGGTSTTGTGSFGNGFGGAGQSATGYGVSASPSGTASSSGGGPGVGAAPGGASPAGGVAGAAATGGGSSGGSGGGPGGGGHGGSSGGSSQGVFGGTVFGTGGTADQNSPQ